MNRHETIFLVGLIVLSTITSFMFVLFGMSIIMSGTAAGTPIFAYITTAYGLGNIAILSLAWSSRHAWAKSVITLISLSYLGVFIMDALNAGTPDAKRFAGILVLALVLYFNWYTVKKVVERV
jgi:hypothetical protein